MVRVEGRVGLYEVVRVDRERRVADITRAGKMHNSEQGIPFKSILCVDAKVSRTIQQFLKS
jgi:hypothetical protein